MILTSINFELIFDVFLLWFDLHVDRIYVDLDLIVYACQYRLIQFHLIWIWFESHRCLALIRTSSAIWMGYHKYGCDWLNLDVISNWFNLSWNRFDFSFICSQFAAIVREKNSKYCESPREACAWTKTWFDIERYIYIYLYLYILSALYLNVSEFFLTWIEHVFERYVKCIWKCVWHASDMYLTCISNLSHMYFKCIRNVFWHVSDMYLKEIHIYKDFPRQPCAFTEKFLEIDWTFI